MLFAHHKFWYILFLVKNFIILNSKKGLNESELVCEKGSRPNESEKESGNASGEESGDSSGEESGKETGKGSGKEKGEESG